MSCSCLFYGPKQAGLVFLLDDGRLYPLLNLEKVHLFLVIAHISIVYKYMCSTNTDLYIILCNTPLTYSKAAHPLTRFLEAFFS